MRFELHLNTSFCFHETGKSGGPSRILNLFFPTAKNKTQIDQPRLWINYFSFKTLLKNIHVENLDNTDRYTNEIKLTDKSYNLELLLTF